MELCVNEITLDELPHKHICMVVGESGKSTLVKKIIQNASIEYGIIISDANHCRNFYDFIEPIRKYRRYSSLLIERCFQDNMYLVLDNYFYNEGIYKEIIKNCREKEILNILTTKEYKDLDVDIIFLLNYDQMIYDRYVKQYLSIDQFKCLLDSLCQYEPLGINCKDVNSIEELFFTICNS